MFQIIMDRTIKPKGKISNFRSADELVKRLQGENGRLKSEVQDLKSRLGNKRAAVRSK